MTTTVNFDASTSEGGDTKLITTYDWDFGDTLHGAGEVVSHDYETGGEYNVTLTVTNECGQTDSLLQCIYLPTQNWTDEFINLNPRWEWGYNGGTGYKLLTTIDSASVVEIGITDQSTSSSYSDCSLHETSYPYDYGVFEARLRYMGDHKFGTIGWGHWNYENPESIEAAWFFAASPESGASLSGFQAMVIIDSTIVYQESIPGIDIEEWHIYRVGFSSDGICFFVDGLEVASTTQCLSKQQRFELWIDNNLPGVEEGRLMSVGLLNMQQDQVMYIDWVKYYEEYFPILTPITFDTTPKGASVTLNGTFIGTT